MSKKIWILLAIIVVIVALIILFSYKTNSKQENVNDIQNNITNAVHNNTEKEEEVQMDTIKIKVNNKVLKVKLANNSTVDAFIEKLKERRYSCKCTRLWEF